MAALTFVAALCVSYLVGSIPCGYLAARAKGVDLRAVGSGNLGATNVGRALGKGWGVAVFTLDFLKGLLPVVLGGLLLVDGGLVPWSRDAVAVALGAAAVAGHVFPVWLGFRGGKGVATSAGFLAGVCWPAVLISGGVWFVALKSTRYVSLSSMLAAVAFPVVFVLYAGARAAFGERLPVTALGVLLAAAILILHRANIGRLLRGAEHRVGEKRPGEKRE
ncbi:MAG: glycerol-3-phosphate 1-O-acyltransferase PlsY [Planctomycetes bacterium]|nr:glycerol-3-phosphate 1-O-acyltransferase PlsY [Planctomycetota bacterium]